ncbi:hypothetical protein [Blastopirellula marina]|uniref:F5/8 type C domain-containing protein n=1 Tax=Blastopirellula marina TaxID=124 RepID=A0A2S8GIH3_9BACT|nr:hypothetical protein [Blastopirellula marina]PQO44247.1 hypothetical protein C5Y93_19995 [Blastopirellula marina]
MSRFCFQLAFALTLSLATASGLWAEEKPPLVILGSEEADLCQALQAQQVPFAVAPSWQAAIDLAPSGGALAVLAEGYPETTTDLPDLFFQQAARKKLRVYLEYPGHIPDLKLEEPRDTRWERVVAASSELSADLAKLRILSMNQCRFVPLKAEDPLLVLARVAGFDQAVYGIPDNASPLLVRLPASEQRPELYVASSKMSAFITARYAPAGAWQAVWQGLLAKLLPDSPAIKLTWTPTVQPSYAKETPLPDDAEEQAFRRGAEWYRKSGLLLTPKTAEVSRAAAEKAEVTNHKPYVGQVGDGSLGMLEGFDSGILPDGSQRVRVILRSDCISESAMALGVAGEVLQDEELTTIAKNLQEYLYERSGAVHGERGDPNHPSYGMVAWGVTNAAWMRSNYGDDIARVVLATLMTEAASKDARWSPYVSRAILANVRTSGPYGFKPANIPQSELSQNGWKHYFESSTVHLAPHFQSYIWACYLAAYQQTGDALLLQRAKTGIRVMMSKYQDEWRWTNGIQQERARMLLPLAWLVRVDDQPEHRDWLRRIATDVLKCQDESGAIREELGRLDHGGFPPHSNNESFGAHEAPLIHENGEPVSDLLYTTNFAFLGLHEAAEATGDPFYKQAENKLAKYLCRIQTSSEIHPELDGAWMRAFDYDRWEYWGSNGDAGWGAWSIESGWTQGWIVAVLGMRLQGTSLWDRVQEVNVADAYQKQRPEMLAGVTDEVERQIALNHDGRLAKTEWETPPAESYRFFGPSSLTDGLLGSDSHRDVQWTGIEGKPLVLNLALDATYDLRQLDLHALQSQSVGIYFPVGVGVEVSMDGKTFVPWESAKWSPEDEVSQASKWLSIAGEPTQARYLRVTIQTRKVIPSGKTAAGGAAWLFVDEIAVNPEILEQKEAK